MIIGNVPDRPVFNILRMAKFEFYLAGSKLLGTDTPDSDWDFMVQHSAEAENFLKECRYIKIIDNLEFEIPYKSNLDLFVYETSSPDDSLSIKNVDYIQITLSKNVRTKLKIYDVLKTNKILREFDMSLKKQKKRADRTELWNAMGALAEQPILKMWRVLNGGI